jgi:hypothetical protein
MALSASANPEVHFCWHVVLQLTLTHAAMEFSAIEIGELALALTLFHLFSLPSVSVEGAGRSWRVVEIARAFRLSGPAKINSEVRTAR